MAGNIRLACKADLPAIDAAYNQAIEQDFLTADLKPVGTRRRTEWFESHSMERYPIYVYEEAGQVLGWLSLLLIVQAAKHCRMWLN